MELAANAVAVLATIVLGLSAGALVAEGAILVPFWQSLQPQSFLAWYREHARLLLRFFAPLEISAAGLTLAAVTLNWFHPVAATQLLVLSAFLAVAVLGAFPLYFQTTNASFAAGTITPARVPEELHRWARWHWTRTMLGVGAFILTLVALLEGAHLPRPS